MLRLKCAAIRCVCRFYSEFCGYGRCTQSLSGCPPQERTKFLTNTGEVDCTQAPFSVCEPVAPDCDDTRSYQVRHPVNRAGQALDWQRSSSVCVVAIFMWTYIEPCVHTMQRDMSVTRVAPTYMYWTGNSAHQHHQSRVSAAYGMRHGVSNGQQSLIPCSIRVPTRHTDGRPHLYHLLRLPGVLPHHRVHAHVKRAVRQGPESRAAVSHCPGHSHHHGARCVAFVCSYAMCATEPSLFCRLVLSYVRVALSRLVSHTHTHSHMQCSVPFPVPCWMGLNQLKSAVAAAGGGNCTNVVF